MLKQEAPPSLGAGEFTCSDGPWIRQLILHELIHSVDPSEEQGKDYKGQLGDPKAYFSDEREMLAYHNELASWFAHCKRCGYTPEQALATFDKMIAGQNDTVEDYYSRAYSHYGDHLRKNSLSTDVFRNNAIRTIKYIWADPSYPPDSNYPLTTYKYHRFA
jgi:hypothetical protein